MGTRETNSQPDVDSSDKAPSIPERDGIVEAALDEFSAAWVNGRNPDPARFCARYAKHAPELRKRIDDFLFVVEGLGSRSWSEEPETRAGSQHSAAQIVGSVLGDFRVLAEIGRGGMGVVYEAEQLSLNRLVALKVLSPHLGFSEEAVLKFRREAEAGGRQSHRGIVSVFAVGEHEGVHYIAQELVPGGRTLADGLREHHDGKELPLGYFRQIAKLLIEAADALSHAHSAGVVHRDVKPSNILIDPDGTPKVTDFGLAKIENALSLSRTGDLTGTPYYMSPEQAMSRRSIIDHRTDVYSLGVTLYEALTLEVPFEGESSQEVLKKILDLEPRDPRKSSARVPRDLAVIALKAMEKEPGRRYATMAEFGDDLRRYVAGEPILARPNSALTKLVKRVKRNPAKSVAALALVALVIALPVLFLFKSAFEDEQERVTGLQLISNSVSVLDSNPGLAALLAIEGMKKDPDAYDKSTLISALLALHEKKALYHDEPVVSAIFSPDSKQIATASGQSARILDALTGKEIRVWDRLGADVVYLQFSPDGKSLLTASKDRTARILDAKTGGERIVFEGHVDALRSAEFSHDGQRVVTVSNDMTIRVWDATSGRELASFIGHGWWPCSAVFDRDGGKILTASEDGTARVWREKEGGYTEEFILKHGNAVNTARFSPCGKFIVTASADKTAVIWDITSTPPSQTTVVTAEAGANDAVFDPTGLRIAVASEDKTIRIYDARSGHEISALRGHGGTVRTVRFSSDGRTLVSASSDRTARLWNDTSGQALILAEGEKDRNHFKISPDGTKIARISEDGKTIRIRDSSRFQKSRDLPHDRVVRPNAIFSPDGKKIVTATYYNTVSVWDLESEKAYKSWREFSGDVVSIDYLQDGGDWILCCADTEAQILEVSGKEGRKVFKHSEKLHSAYFCKDGETILTVGKNGLAQIWSIVKEQSLKNLSTSLSVRFVDFDKDGERILLADQDGNVVIWDYLSENDWKKKIDSDEEISRIELRPNCDEFLVNGRSRRAMVLDFSSDEGSIRCSHRGEIQPPVFSRDGKSLLTVPDEKTVAVRKIIESSFEFKVTLKKSVRQVMFSRDEKGVVVAVDDGDVMLLPLDPLQIALKAVPRGLTPFEKEEYYIAGEGGTEDSGGSSSGIFRVRSGNQLRERPSPSRRMLSPDEYSEVGELGDLHLMIFGKDGTSFIRINPVTGASEKVSEFLSDDERSSFSVRPAGERIFYCRRKQNEKYDHMVRDLLSGKDHVLSNDQDHYVGGLSWHPTKDIAYRVKHESTDGHGGNRIMSLDVSADSDGKTHAILVRPRQHFGSFDVSPDGAQVCFTHFPGHSWVFDQEVWIADMDSSGRRVSNPKRLTFDSYADRYCRFSPDGKYIYWSRYKENTPACIFRMNRDGSEKVMILPGEADALIGFFTVTSSGHIVYFTTSGGYRSVEIADINGKRVTSFGIDNQMLSLPVE